MSITSRIERLEQAAAAAHTGSVSGETFRAVLAAIQNDELAIDLLREAAVLQDSQSWSPPADANNEVRQIIDRLGVAEVAPHEGVSRLRAEASTRLRRLIVREFGEHVAEQVCGEAN